MTTQQEFDAVVVGSGPGGATVARELSRRKKKVLILEKGTDAPFKESFFGIASIVNNEKVSDEMVMTRAFAAGGTSTLFFGVADFPPLDLFRSLGIDLSKELDEVRKEVPIAELPDELLGPQSRRLRESVTSLGYPWLKRSMMVDLSKCRSGYSYESKWNARASLREAVGNGATLLSRATALKVLVDKNRAVGVEYQLKKGRSSEIRQAFGAKIILAAGALATPVILHKSGVKNIVNRPFRCNPNFSLFGTVPGLKGGDSFGGAMNTDPAGDIIYADANLTGTFYRLTALSRGKFFNLFSHRTSLGVGVMIKDVPGGKLHEDGRFYKQLTAEESERLRKAEQVARKMIENAGGRNIFKSGLGAAHVSGVLKFKEHLDAGLQTEFSNLHVCDGSVIPEERFLAPALTLICLGKYLANRLN
jgi:GMC oxidoreductase/NAD(P)-binding Rossmann-like domain